jgi:endoglucanase
MKSKFKNVWMVVCVLILSNFQGQSQEFLHTQGKKIVNGDGDEVLLRSMGLGGWMIQEGYMLETSAFAGTQHEIKAAIQELIGTENTDTFYTAWLNNHVRRADIDSLASWGFNSIRLPMHYNLFTPQDLPVGQYINRGFELVDSVLSWCSANQMYLILDLHGAPGGQGDDAAISDYDPDKPSLWESEENKARTADLWKTIAARYADEPWIGGYDLINEPKWEALLSTNNIDLWNLLTRITDSIRTVDANHMIIVEGNMWANNYTGFPGPWDDNFVISFHKYWNQNTTAAIQWVLTMRNQYNVPIWLGETGENSNTWFVELIELMEQNSIGYSFWPEKKLSSVAGPVTVIKTLAYQELLDYWTDTTLPRPDTAYAKSSLMEMAENLKLENCSINRDVTDAFSRQVNSNQTLPYKQLNLPGVIHATDYDLGRQGFAYFDTDYQNTGNGSWNSGGKYRNDGVDIETCGDNLNTNGYDVGWTAAGEWLKYTAEIDSTAGYDLIIRFAGPNNNTLIHFEVDSIDITGSIAIPATTAWNVWDSLTIPDIILPKGTHSLVLFFDQGGCNLSWFSFQNPVLIDELPFRAISAETDSLGSTIFLTLNKPCISPSASSFDDFTCISGDVEQSPSNISVSDRILTLELEHGYTYKDMINLSYSGTSIETSSGQFLENFLMMVTNNIPSRHAVPGKMEAEDYFRQSGIETETTTDAGGGLNIGYTDAGDYLDFLVDVQSAQIYQVNFRIASLNQSGAVQLQIIDDEENTTILGNYTFQVTGGWQTWRTKSGTAELPAGMYILRILITAAGFNLNWLSFTQPSSTQDNEIDSNVLLFPNPCREEIYANFIDYPYKLSGYLITDIAGRILVRKEMLATDTRSIKIDTSTLKPGVYLLSIIQESLGSGMFFRVEE